MSAPTTTSRAAPSAYQSDSGANKTTYHRQHDSISTVSSAGTRGSERGSSRSGTSQSPAVDSAVTRLLVAIKKLLESLTLWSAGKMNENQVSDVYVRLGNDFNAVVAAFTQYRIDMSDLLSVPDDLRGILEQALAEDATPANLELYLPQVRSIITSLLHGLRAKQSSYRQTLDARNERRQRGESSLSSSTRDSAQIEPSASGGSIPTPPPSQGRTSSSRPQRTESSTYSSSASLPQSPTVDTGSNNRSAQGSFAPPSQRSSESSAPLEEKNPERTITPTPSRPPSGTRNRVVGGSLGSSRPFERRQSPNPPDDEAARRPGYMSRTRSSPNPNFAGDDDNIGDLPAPIPQTPPQPTVPPDVRRYSLSDRPAPVLPALVFDTPSRSDGPSVPSTPGPDVDGESAPVLESSLAALKRSDVLERRASKRFSSFTYNKIAGTPAGGPRSEKSMHRRSMLAPSSMLTAGDLDALTEENENEGEETTTMVSSQPKRKPSVERTTSLSRKRSADGNINGRKAYRPSPLSEESASTPPVPPIPQQVPQPAIKSDAAAEDATIILPKTSTLSSSASSPQAMKVFLQVGRQVKKVQIDSSGLSHSSLRVLFVDIFSYNPGVNNFPAIYIRDPSSGVQYELEDVDEVRDGAVLSLNIEPLDQIKQHIDLQMSSLQQDIKDLKAAVTSSAQRGPTISPSSSSLTAPSMAFSMTAPERPTERQFQTFARRFSKMNLVADKFKTSASSTSPLSSPLERAADITIVPQMTGTLAPQMTGGSTFTDAASSRIVNDLKTQFDEVQNLRRDLGVMRQLYVDFVSQTKESLGSLRTQTLNVRQLASSKVGGARAYIDSGKAKLDARSQDVLTKVEMLQDTVENLKEDVLKRHITPKLTLMKQLRTDIEWSSKELESLTDYIQTVKPMWKKTWQEELQNIVEEQQFLGHQEEFLTDLLEDHKALTEVFGHVEKVVSMKKPGTASRGGRGFRPAPQADASGDVLSNVMLEIRTSNNDPDKRLKAIEASQRQRELELAGKGDEFQEELTGFVGGKKLKMTGGAEEAERVRQRRDDLARKAMFSPSTSATSQFTNGSISPSPSWTPTG